MSLRVVGKNLMVGAAYTAAFTILFGYLTAWSSVTLSLAVVAAGLMLVAAGIMEFVADRTGNGTARVLRRALFLGM